MPEPQRRVPSEKVAQKNPALQSASSEQVPHSSVDAHEERAPIRREASKAATRGQEGRRIGAMGVDSGRCS